MTTALTIDAATGHLAVNGLTITPRTTLDDLPDDFVFDAGAALDKSGDAFVFLHNRNYRSS